MQFSHFMSLLSVLIGFGNMKLVLSESESENKYFGKIPSETGDPINITTSKVKNIAAPITLLFGDLNNDMELINNGILLDAIIKKDSTLSSITAGIFGKDVYLLKRIKYRWSDTKDAAGIRIDGKGYPLEALVVFYNKKYGTFEESLNHRDGQVIMNYPIKFCSGLLSSNLFFDITYAPKIKQVQEAGSKVSVKLGMVVFWYAALILPTSKYYAYPGSYLNETTGQRYNSATIMVIPHEPLDCLSKAQFEATFGSLKNPSGKPLTNRASQFPQNMEVVQGSGLLHIVF